ncbi:MAG: L,D-transpeptidase family protein [Sulfurovum sp.]
MKYIILFIFITTTYFASVHHLIIPTEKNPFAQITIHSDLDIIKALTKIQERYKQERAKEQRLALIKERKAKEQKKLDIKEQKRKEKYAQKIIAQKLKDIERRRQEAFAKLEQAIILREQKIKDNAILATIDISEQRMHVYKGNNLLYKWKVSTGRKGYYTPRGKYSPKYMEKMHYSRKYNNSPMPYSIFFNYTGYAIHGTKSVHRLGRPASHGCVRLHTQNAKLLYRLIQKAGKDNSIIHITK